MRVRFNETCQFVWLFDCPLQMLWHGREMRASANGAGHRAWCDSSQNSAKAINWLAGAVRILMRNEREKIFVQTQSNLPVNTKFKQHVEYMIGMSIRQNRSMLFNLRVHTPIQRLLFNLRVPTPIQRTQPMDWN